MLFKSLNFKPWIIQTLDSLHIKEPTDIQFKTFLKENINRSLIITSKTGSGKTYCYSLPILNNIDLSLNQIQALIILPTKELSRQIYAKFYDFVKNNNQLKVKLLIGDNQTNLNSILSSHIVIGTPNKIYELTKQTNLNKYLKFFVLDEADMLIDFGFFNTIQNIFNKVKNNSLQKFATSATLHTSLANYLKNIFTNTKVISTSNSIWLNDHLTHNIVYQASNNDYFDTLTKFLNIINPYFCLIFANTKKIANQIYELMVKKNYNVGLIHQDLFERQRKQIFNKIKNNVFQYVVCTDLIARGVDLPNADIVISVGLPNDTSFYIHRAGRVGRGKKTGNSYLIYQSGQDNLINNLINKGIQWNFLLINNKNELINKNKPLKIKRKIVYDHSVNAEIKRIYHQGSKKIKPGYKKKIKSKIKEIKQKQRHLHIEKKIKQQLLLKNIRNYKRNKNK